MNHPSWSLVEQFTIDCPDDCFPKDSVPIKAACPYYDLSCLCRRPECPWEGKRVRVSVEVQNEPEPPPSRLVPTEVQVA